MASEPAEEVSEEDQLQELPEQLRKRVCMPDRPIYEGANKRARTAIASYTDTHSYAVRFEDMKIGDTALIYAPERDAGSPLAFRLMVGRKQLSPWLFMCTVKGINRSEKEITWFYICPVSFTEKSLKSVAVQKASQSKNWKLMSASKQTARFDEDEVVISWEREETDLGHCVPVQQYKQAQLVMLAVEQLQNKGEATELPENMVEN